jgi:CRISPR-associated protein Cas1
MKNQNTLYLTTPGTVLVRDHLTLRVEIEKQTKLAVPIHHLESICAFGQVVITPPAMALCWDHQVAIHYHTENGYLLARVTGSGDTSYLRRRAQYTAADTPAHAWAIARQIIAGKLQNSRTNLLRSKREATGDEDQKKLTFAAREIARLIRQLGQTAPPPEGTKLREALDPIRGTEGIGAKLYFQSFTPMLKQQRDAFTFSIRTRRPPRDKINCLLSFLYALLRHDCLAALTTAGLDPYVGWLHATRPGRPAAALDLMEEFRPWLADRLAITLVNRQQIEPKHFNEREGGAVEFTDKGRREVIQAWQKRKQAELHHPLFKQEIRLQQLFPIQARLLARHLRGDLPHYLPFIPK